MLGADIVARMLLRPAELPLGVVMAIVGAPIFLHMVVRRGDGRELIHARGASRQRYRRRQLLLTGVDVAVRPGRIVVLIGPNGAGKSTLLRVLSGELMPTHGGALLDGRPLAAFSAAELARRRAVVPQASALALSVHRARGGDARHHRARAFAHRPPPHARRGSRRWPPSAYPPLPTASTSICRAASASAPTSPGPCARSPRPPARADQTRCLLLDEPTSNLDLAHQGLVLAAVRRQASGGTAVLAVMHDLNLAAALADELVLLVGGEIKASGPPRQVLRDGLLSAAYGCPVSPNRTPGGDRPFVLPPAVFFAQPAPAIRLVADAPDPLPAATTA